jgi:RND family efflux transporter MFP subunit
MRSPLRILILSVLVSPLAAQDSRQVQAFEIKPRSIDTRSQVQGDVLPLESMRLIPRVSGYITKIHVAEGSVVKRDALLVDLHVPELERDKAIADAMVKKADALLSVANSAVLAAKEASKVAVANDRAAASETDVAVSALKLSEANHKRVKDLHAGRAATDEEWEEAQLDLAMSRSALQAAQSAQGATTARIGQAAANVAQRDAEAERAAAGVDVAKAEAARAAVFVSFASLRSPYSSARVTRQLVDAGTLAMAQKTEILELMNTSRVRIRFGVPQAEAVHVKPGSVVSIVIPGEARADVSATVTRVAGAVHSGSRNMFAEVELDNSSGEWIPGTIVKIDLLVEKAVEAIIIPSRALVNIRAETYVWIVNAGRAKRIRVKPGSVVERGKVRILTGLTAGTQVLVSGFTGLKGGELLSVRKVEK